MAHLFVLDWGQLLKLGRPPHLDEEEHLPDVGTHVTHPVSDIGELLG